jgi:putative ABC transport system permease protein
MMGFKILEGRNFLKDSEAEAQNVICNEAAARKFGWKLNTLVGSGHIVGIMKDFNYISLREQVEPFMFWYSNDSKHFGAISLKLTDGANTKALADIGKIYSSLNPKFPFRYYFLDDHLNLLYSKENQQAKLVTAFSLLSVIVSVLGILGLSIFMCQYKIKEIGIRKVNGARISEVMAMLNRDFIKWVAIAFIIATPVAYFAMNRWLESFAYKTTLSWWIFALAGLLALGIALLTVSWQSWKAATRNPVEALRYE